MLAPSPGVHWNGHESRRPVAFAQPPPAQLHTNLDSAAHGDRCWTPLAAPVGNRSSYMRRKRPVHAGTPHPWRISHTYTPVLHGEGRFGLSSEQGAGESAVRSWRRGALLTEELPSMPGLSYMPRLT